MALDTQSGSVSKGLYDAFRSNGAPTYYGEDPTPWRADILEAGFIFAGCILAVAFFSILPGIHGKSRWFTCIWIVLGIFVGTSILVTNYSPEWESAEVLTKTKYKAGTGKDIEAKVGIHIGLRGINVTLKGEPVHQLNETINYNEHFSWSWRQGRIGFGPFASQFNQEYRAAQFRGLPLPILWIAEYFTLDGEFIRWGRFYREAGLFAHACLWYYFLDSIGVLDSCEYNVVYVDSIWRLPYCAYGFEHVRYKRHQALLRAPLDLVIPFSAEHILAVHYGAAFWLCLITGIMCVVIGLVILILDLRLPLATANFFGMDILQDEKLLETEHSSLSAHSDLTEIVEVRIDGQVVRKLDVRPTGAPKTGSDVKQFGKGNTDDASGEQNWEDVSSESDLDPTDDECDYPVTVPQKRRESKGLFQRFQTKRRVSLANLNGKGNRSTQYKGLSHLGSHGRKGATVTPELHHWK